MIAGAYIEDFNDIVAGYKQFKKDEIKNKMRLAAANLPGGVGNAVISGNSSALPVTVSRTNRPEVAQGITV